GLRTGIGRRVLAAPRAAARTQRGQERLVAGLAAERASRGNRQERLCAGRAERAIAQRFARAAPVREQECGDRLEQIAQTGPGHGPERACRRRASSPLQRELGEQIARERGQLAGLPAARLGEGALHFRNEAREGATEEGGG